MKKNILVLNLLSRSKSAAEHIFFSIIKPAAVATAKAPTSRGC